MPVNVTVGFKPFPICSSLSICGCQAPSTALALSIVQWGFSGSSPGLFWFCRRTPDGRQTTTRPTPATTLLASCQCSLWCQPSLFRLCFPLLFCGRQGRHASAARASCQSASEAETVEATAPVAPEAPKAMPTLNTAARRHRHTSTTPAMPGTALQRSGQPGTQGGKCGRNRRDLSGEDAEKLRLRRVRKQKRFVSRL